MHSTSMWPTHRQIHRPRCVRHLDHPIGRILCKACSTRGLIVHRCQIRANNYFAPEAICLSTCQQDVKQSNDTVYRTCYVVYTVSLRDGTSTDVLTAPTRVVTSRYTSGRYAGRPNIRYLIIDVYFIATKRNTYTQSATYQTLPRRKRVHNRTQNRGMAKARVSPRGGQPH